MRWIPTRQRLELLRGAYRAYAIKRMVEEERWDSEFIKSLQGTPQQPDPRRRDITVPISLRFEAKTAQAQVQPAKEMVEPASRRRGITNGLGQVRPDTWVSGMPSKAERRNRQERTL